MLIFIVQLITCFITIYLRCSILVHIDMESIENKC